MIKGGRYEKDSSNGKVTLIERTQLVEDKKVIALKKTKSESKAKKLSDSGEQ